MNIIKSFIFSLFFYGWCLLCFLLCLPLLAGPRGWVRKAGQVWLKGIDVLLKRIIGLSYTAIGTEHIPPHPLLYAVKHQSSWETLILLLCIPNGVFILKRELLLLPFLGWYLKKTGQIAIDRGAGPTALKSILRRSKEAVSQGLSPIIFPEGTRVAPGYKKPYQPGIAALYKELNLPVIPVALNSGLFWPRDSFIKKQGNITLRFLPGIEPGLSRKDFMLELEKRIEEASNQLLA